MFLVILSQRGCAVLRMNIVILQLAPLHSTTLVPSTLQGMQLLFHANDCAPYTCMLCPCTC